MIPIETISFKENYSNGIVAYLIRKYGNIDIVENNIVSIEIYSQGSNSNNPSIIFGTNNADYSRYRSSGETEETKYFFFDFKQYSLSIQGISLRTGNIDWYNQYHVYGSYDNFRKDSKTIINNNKNPYHEWQYFEFQTKTTPSRFLNISVQGKTMHSTSPKSNFAIYGIEFFGDIFRTSRDIVCMLCTCNKKLTYIHLKYFLNFQFIIFHSRT